MYPDPSQRRHDQSYLPSKHFPFHRRLSGAFLQKNRAAKPFYCATASGHSASGRDSQSAGDGDALPAPDPLTKSREPFGTDMLSGRIIWIADAHRDGNIPLCGRMKN
jgi:hypothetical protein